MTSHGAYTFTIIPLRVSDRSCLRTYRLEIVQHPDRTAEFGASTLTRLPLAPPLIAQLVLRDSSGRIVIE